MGIPTGEDHVNRPIPTANTGFLSLIDPYLEEAFYEKARRRGRPTLREIRWTLYPSNVFAEEIIAGNTAMLRLRQRAEKTAGE
jgi:hypothetical protein